MPKGELEDHKVCPKSIVAGQDSLETSDARGMPRFRIKWLVLNGFEGIIT